MISTMGDAAENAVGDFILFDKNFECIGTWTKGKKAPCGYDFWYQPYFNVMVSSEWGAPKVFRRGFQLDDIGLEEDTGRRLNFYDWKEQKLVDTVHLGDEGRWQEGESALRLFHISQFQASLRWRFASFTIRSDAKASSVLVFTRMFSGSTRKIQPMRNSFARKSSTCLRRRLKDGLRRKSTE